MGFTCFDSLPFVPTSSEAFILDPSPQRYAAYKFIQM